MSTIARDRTAILADRSLPTGAAWRLPVTIGAAFSLSGKFVEARLRGRHGQEGTVYYCDSTTASALTVSGQTITIIAEPDAVSEASGATTTVADVAELVYCEYALDVLDAAGGTVLMRIQGNLDWTDYSVPEGVAGSASAVTVSIADATATTVAVSGAGQDGVSAYVYVGYASDDAGSDYTATPDQTSTYVAFKATSSPIETPDADDFAGLWVAISGGSGTVTSVAVSGSDGIQVDSGSPVTSSGTIALGIDASALSTHLGLGDAATKNTGTSAGTVAAGDDSRLSDARTPTAHASSHHTGGTDALAPADIGAATSAQGSLADSAIQPGDLATVATTGTYADLSGAPTLGNSAALDVGTTTGTVAAGDDSRLSDSRTPTAHAASHVNGTDDIQDATASQKGLMTAAYASKLDGIEALADVTDAANVEAAGAVMDSEVTSLSGVKSLTVPDNTTISTFGASLVDDTDAATARATLDVDQAGTDNSTDVTLAGTPDYLTLSGQQITLGSIDLATDVTGTLPVANGGTGQTALSSIDAAELGSAAATDGYVLTADGAGGAAWEAVAGGGGGTVTSVAVSGSDGIQVDSGSPITSSGTIALGIDASALSTHLSLGDAATKNTGTTSGTVAAGDHTHAQLHDAATVSGNGIAIAGQQISLDIGTGSTQVAAGDHTHSAFTGDSGSGGAVGFVPAPAAGDAAAGKYLDADGTWTVPSIVGGIGITIDGAGSAISTGIVGDVSVPYDGTITSVEILADQSGSIVVDLWKDTGANYPPTDADSITASAPPTLSSATRSIDSTLTGWTTSVSAGDTIRFNVDSVSTVTRISLLLKITRT